MALRKTGNTTSDALSKYKYLDKLGEGTYGVVYKAVHLETGKEVAIKKIRLDMEDEGVPPTAIREISLLKEICMHANVVTLYEVVHRGQKLNLVFEYLPTDLKAYMESRKPLRRDLVKKWTFQIIAGIHFCHSRRILHRDLKPANLLIDSNMNLKLGDFGLARAFCVPLREYTHEVVTLWYRSPEVLLGTNQYSTPLDIWSIGCIMAELVSKVPLFAGDSEIDQLYKIFKVLGTPNETIWPGVTELPDFRPFFPRWNSGDIADVVTAETREFRDGLDPVGFDLLRQLLKYVPSQRISARHALQHAWFHEVPREVKQSSLQI